MSTNIDLPIAVTAADRTSMDRQLDEAVTEARTRALQEGRRGILVTRQSFDTFTVALSDDVPFGTTHESVQW